MTPMVIVCCLRRERATTFARYFISLAAAKTRSCVIFGMERAAGAAVRTRETVATERPRCVASVLRLTARGADADLSGDRSGTAWADFGVRVFFFADFGMPKCHILARVHPIPR